MKLAYTDSDFQLTKIVGAGIAIVTAIIAVVLPLVAWISGDPLVTPLETDAVRGAVGDPRPGVELSPGSEVIAQFNDAGPGLWLASIAPSLLFVALLAAVMWLLWRLLDDVRAGNAFTMANIARMRGIAAVIVGGAVLVFFAQGLANGVLVSHALEGPSVLFEARGSASDLLLPGVGFLIAALAEAFRRGVQLEDDVEGLV